MALEVKEQVAKLEISPASSELSPAQSPALGLIMASEGIRPPDPLQSKKGHKKKAVSLRAPFNRHFALTLKPCSVMISPGSESEGLWVPG